MRIAQQLYEGVDVPGEGSVGLITYMRTDSLNLSAEAVQAARGFIGDALRAGLRAREGQRLRRRRPGAGGPRGHPPHRRHPPSRGRHRRSLTDEQARLYDLIWRRFVACQMTPAVWNVTEADHRRRHQGRLGGVQGHRPATRLRRLPPRRRPAQPRRRADPAAAGGPARPGARGPGAHAALHPAAAAVHRGLAGQGAGGRRHRPAQHLRHHHPDHPGPQLRRAARPQLLPHRPGHHGHRQARRALPADLATSASPPTWKTSSTRSRKPT